MKTDEYETFTFQPVMKWRITIPKGGNFNYYTGDHLNWWVRFWLKFIGWGVERLD